MPVNELDDLIRKEVCRLWIGAGFSKYARYPLATDLQKILLEDCDINDRPDLINQNSLSEFCEIYQIIHDRPQLIKRLLEIFQMLLKRIKVGKYAFKIIR
jgi:hypothetical protein